MFLLPALTAALCTELAGPWSWGLRNKPLRYLLWKSLRYQSPSIYVNSPQGHNSVAARNNLHPSSEWLKTRAINQDGKIAFPPPSTASDPRWWLWLATPSCIRPSSPTAYFLIFDSSPSESTNMVRMRKVSRGPCLHLCIFGLLPLSNPLYQRDRDQRVQEHGGPARWEAWCPRPASLSSTFLLPSSPQGIPPTQGKFVGCLVPENVVIVCSSFWSWCFLSSDPHSIFRNTSNQKISGHCP